MDSNPNSKQSFSTRESRPGINFLPQDLATLGAAE